MNCDSFCLLLKFGIMNMKTIPFPDPIPVPMGDEE